MVWTPFLAQSPGASTAISIRSSDTIYANARGFAGARVVNTTGTLARWDQELTSGLNKCFQQILSFDTSSVGSLPRAARLEIAASTFFFGDNFIGVGTVLGDVEVYVNDYGADVTTADWVDGATLSIANRVAYIEATRFVDKNIAVAAQKRVALNSNGLASAVTLGGITKLMVCTSAFRIGTGPAAVANQLFVESWDASGDRLAPCLWLDIGDPGVDRPAYR